MEILIIWKKKKLKIQHHVKNETKDMLLHQVLLKNL